MVKFRQENTFKVTPAITDPVKAIVCNFSAFKCF